MITETPEGVKLNVTWERYVLAKPDATPWYSSTVPHWMSPEDGGPGDVPGWGMVYHVEIVHPSSAMGRTLMDKYRDFLTPPGGKIDDWETHREAFNSFRIHVFRFVGASSGSGPTIRHPQTGADVGNPNFGIPDDTIKQAVKNARILPPDL